MRATGLDLHFLRWRKLWSGLRPAGNQQHAPGVLHLDGFESRFFSIRNIKEEAFGLLFYIWCGQQDSNLHGRPLEPKSNVSANSTMPAWAYSTTGCGCLSINPRVSPCGNSKFRKKRFTFVQMFLTFGSRASKIDSV